MSLPAPTIRRSSIFFLTARTALRAGTISPIGAEISRIRDTGGARLHPAAAGFPSTSYFDFAQYPSKYPEFAEGLGTPSRDPERESKGRFVFSCRSEERRVGKE